MQDSSYGVPIGTVIAWPLETDPLGLHNDHWLECNGQEVNKSKYPRLAELMSNVPDYRGMFLRGLGKTKTNDPYYGTVDHAADSLGVVQGDSARELDGGPGFLAYGGITGGTDGGTGHPPESSLGGKLQPFWHPDDAEYGFSYAPPVSNYSNGFYETNALDGNWYSALTKHEYIPHVSKTNVAGFGDVVTDITFDVQEIHPKLTFFQSSGRMYFDVSRVWPVSHEFRPINTAVRYMIKAK